MPSPTATVAAAASAPATPAPATPARAAQAPTLSAHVATLKGSRGVVFGPVTFESTTPITLVHGKRGSGRTSFLLACGGRMRLGSGDLEVLGLDARRMGRALRNCTGIAGFDAIDALEPSATVAEAIRERMTWSAPWYRRVPTLGEQDVAAALSSVWGELAKPSASCLVRDLSERDDLLLRIALALIERPLLITVDDLDGVKDPAERAEVAARIETIAATGVAFILGSTDHRDADLFSASLTSAFSI